MKVLTVYANPNPRSFCHAILEQFSQGLKDAGHTNEVVDLYAIKFDPVLKLRDYASWIDETTPMETLKAMTHSSTNRIEWLFIERWFRHKDVSDVVKLTNTLIDDFGFRYPGIKNVEHVYFYSVGEVDAATRQNYLQQAYHLGKEFAR